MPYSPQSIREEMLTLAEVVLRQTKQDKVKWSPTDDDDQFLFSSAKSSLLIRGDIGQYDYESTPEDEGDFSLMLLNRNGSVAGRLEVEFGIVYDESQESERYQEYLLLKRLYFEAQSRALEIDATPDDIHQALGLSGSSGSVPPNNLAEGSND
jgi:hypothetical protein